MRNISVCAFILITLAGCQQDAERRDAQDDSYCRSQVTRENDTRAGAYQDCRTRMMQYHTQQAIAASGR